MGNNQGRRPRSYSDGHLKKQKNSYLLNNFRKHQIQSSWMIAQKRSKESVAERVFLRVFKRHPDMQRMFGFQSIPFSQLKTNPRFLAHAQTVQTQLQKLVDNLDDLESVESSLFRLGLRHAVMVDKLGQTRFVLAKHWDSVAEAIVFCVTEGQKFPGLYGSWRVLVCWMINQMRDGLMSHNLLQGLQLINIPTMGKPYPRSTTLHGNFPTEIKKLK